MLKSSIFLFLLTLTQKVISTSDKHCGEVPKVEFGSFSHGASNVGSRLSLTCKAFTKLQGNSTIECQSNGQWSQPGQCKIIKCEAPVIANAIVSSGTSEFGHRAMFMCHHHFKLFGVNLIECKRDSTWDVQGSCVSICGTPDVSNGTYKIQGLSGELECNEGFEAEGNTTALCSVESKQWTSLGECVQKKVNNLNFTQRFIEMCGSLPKIKNGTVIVSEVDDYLLGMIKCEPNFEVVGDRLFFCLSTGTMTQPGSCQIPVIEKCGMVPEIDDGLVSPGDYKIGSRRTISCNNSLYLSGNETIECQNDGQWTEPGKCIEKKCPKPKIENGKVKNETQEMGKLVHFSCLKGYKLDGIGEMICSDFKWHIYGSCKHICGEFPELSNGSFKMSTLSLTAEVICDTGFKLKGISSVLCDENLGVWSYPGKCLNVSLVAAFPRLDDLDLLLPLNEVNKGNSLVNSKRISISNEHLKSVIFFSI